MKNVSLWVSFIFIISLAGCKKNQDVIPTADDSNTLGGSTTFLKLSPKEYEDLSLQLKNDFTTPEKVTGKDIQTLKSTIDTSLKPKKVDFGFIASEIETVLNKYPKLQGFNSMLKIYNQALRTTNANELQLLAGKYHNFLLYIPELNIVTLTVTRHSAALLSPDGVIQVGDNIVAFDDNSATTFKASNPNVVSKLDSISNSHKQGTTQMRNTWGPKTYGINSTDGYHKVFLYKAVTYDLYLNVYPIWYGSTEAISVLGNTVYPVYVLIITNSVHAGAVGGGYNSGCYSSNGNYNVYYLGTECKASNEFTNPISLVDITSSFQAIFYDGHNLSGNRNF